MQQTSAYPNIEKLCTLCVHNESFKLSQASGQALAERIMDTVGTLHMKPLDLERFLLPAGHPYLLQELGQLTMVKHKARVSLNSGWPKVHEQRFKKRGAYMERPRATRGAAIKPVVREPVPQSRKRS